MAAKIVSRGEIFQLSGRLYTWQRPSAQLGDVHPRLHELDSLPFDDLIYSEADMFKVWELLSYYGTLSEANMLKIWRQTYKVDEEGKIFTLVSGDDDGDIVVDYASAVLLHARVQILGREEESKDVEEQHERRWRWEHLNLNLESTAGRRRSLLPAHLYFGKVEENAEGFVWPPKEMLQSFIRVGVLIGALERVDAMFGQLADDINIPGLHLLAEGFINELDESPAWQWVDALTLLTYSYAVNMSNMFDLLHLCRNLSHFSWVPCGPSRTRRQPTEAENQKLVQALTQESSKLTHLRIQVPYQTEYTRLPDAIAVVIQHPGCRLSRLDLRTTYYVRDAACSNHEALFGALAVNKSLCDLGLDIATASHLQPLLSTSSKLADFFTQRLLVLRLSIQENDDNYSEMQAVLEQLAQSLSNINNNVRFLDLEFHSVNRKTLGRTFWLALLPPDQSTAASLQYAGNNPNKPAATPLLQALRIAPLGIVQVAGGLADYLDSPLCPLLWLELRKSRYDVYLEREEEWELANSLSENFSLCTLSLPGYEWSNPEAKARAHSLIERNLLYKAGQLLQEPTVQPTVARVFLCGHGEAGKTTLCRSLLLTQKSAFRRAATSAWRTSSYSKARRRTRGMEFHPLHFNSGKLLICDLGGQEEFHSFHHYMMNATHNDLFIVVCKLQGHHLSQDEFNGELRYWLKFIVVHTRVGAYTSGSSSTSPSVKPKVLVVVNFFFKDEAMLDTARSRAVDLMKAFSEVLDFGFISADRFGNLFGISAKKVTQVQAVNNRLGTLLQELLESARPIPQLCSHISEKVLPALRERQLSWINFPDLLRRTAAKPALFSTFREILEQCRYMLPASAIKVRAALMELHNQGVLLFFPKEGGLTSASEDDSTLVITDSGWFCHKFIGELLAVYIEAQREQHTSSAHNGQHHDLSIWNTKDIENMLRNQGCKKEHLGEMVRYLQGLELCFALDQDKDEVEQSKKMLLFPALLKEKTIEYPKASEFFFGRRLQCAKSSLHLVPSGVFARLQVRLRKVCNNESYKLGYCWASFMKGNIGAMLRFGGAVTEPWENKVCIDILVFCPQQEEFDRTSHSFLIGAEDLMCKLKDEIYAICQSVDYSGIPSVTLQESVLKHKGPSPSVIKLAEVKKQALVQNGYVNWPGNVKEATPVERLLLPKELNEHVQEQLNALATIRDEYSFGVNADDAGVIISQQNFSDHSDRNRGKMPVVESEADEYAGSSAQEHSSREWQMIIRKELEIFGRHRDEKMQMMMKEFLSVIREGIQSLAKHLQDAKRDIISNCSTRLLEHELREDRAYPLYPYWVDAELGKLKSLLVMKKARLHFMCESPDDGPHPVEGQKGKEMTIHKTWVANAARVMVPAFRVLCCLARIGATVLLPGTHVFLPSPDCLVELGIEKEALQHVILPEALKNLLDGVPDVNPKRPLRANEVKEDLKPLLSNENIDMHSDFGLQRFSFGQGKVHWVCEKHRPVTGILLESPPNPFK